jgi:hypothetical protein
LFDPDAKHQQRVLRLGKRPPEAKTQDQRRHNPVRSTDPAQKQASRQKTDSIFSHKGRFLL